MRAAAAIGQFSPLARSPPVYGQRAFQWRVGRIHCNSLRPSLNGARRSPKSAKSSLSCAAELPQQETLASGPSESGITSHRKRTGASKKREKR